MAAAPKPIKRLGGATPSTADIASLQYDPPSIPLDLYSIAQAVLQLQNTVNEVITRLNALATATSNPGDAVTGTAQAATNLFTNS